MNQKEYLSPRVTRHNIDFFTLYWLFEPQENDVTAKLIDIIGEYLLLSALCWATVCLIATIPGALASDTATLEMREWKCWCEVQWKRKPTVQEGSLK